MNLFKKIIKLMLCSFLLLFIIYSCINYFKFINEDHHIYFLGNDTCGYSVNSKHKRKIVPIPLKNENSISGSINGISGNSCKLILWTSQGYGYYIKNKDKDGKLSISEQEVKYFNNFDNIQGRIAGVSGNSIWTTDGYAYLVKESNNELVITNKMNLDNIQGKVAGVNDNNGRIIIWTSDGYAYTNLKYNNEENKLQINDSFNLIDNNLSILGKVAGAAVGFRDLFIYTIDNYVYRVINNKPILLEEGDYNFQGKVIEARADNWTTLIRTRDGQAYIYERFLENGSLREIKSSDKIIGGDVENFNTLVWSNKNIIGYNNLDFTESFITKNRNIKSVQFIAGFISGTVLLLDGDIEQFSIMNYIKDNITNLILLLILVLLSSLNYLRVCKIHNQVIYKLLFKIMPIAIILYIFIDLIKLFENDFLIHISNNYTHIIIFYSIPIILMFLLYIIVYILDMFTGSYFIENLTFKDITRILSLNEDSHLKIESYKRHYFTFSRKLNKHEKNIIKDEISKKPRRLSNIINITNFTISLSIITSPIIIWYIKYIISI